MSAHKVNCKGGPQNNARLITAFIARQVDQIREGSWPELSRKLRLAFPMMIKAAFALLIVLIIRVIRPFCLVRFQDINSVSLGHFAANRELYLCERDAGINVPKNNYVDIWYHTTTPCNRQLGRMWSRILNIAPSHSLWLVVLINSLIPGGDAHRIGENTQRDRDVHNLLDRFPPHLVFLPEEEKRGQDGLRALGIPRGASFICLNVRDSAYLNDRSSRRNEKADWSYHNYRDCNIKNYALAARELANRGYYVVRMGAVVKEAMNVAHPMIIDYATNGMRRDFMDIYLGAKCEFCISNATGFNAVPFIFRRPIVYVDHVPLYDIATFSSKFLAITKKHWLRDESRFMTFREIFESGAGCFLQSKKYEDIGVDLLESTPEEIAAVVLEMESRLKGNWQTTEEDEALQRRFWEIFQKCMTYESKPLHGEIRSRIGADFLRKNKAWLE